MLNFFSIPLAVTVMLIVCNLMDVYLNTVQLNSGITLSSPKKRSWLIDPNLSGKGKLSWGMAVLAAFPAFFVVIVIFIETEITVLMCYKVSHYFSYFSCFEFIVLYVLLIVLITNYQALYQLSTIM